MARKHYLPLRGVRVLAFETAFSLPAGTRTLSELGAEVVRVQAPGRGFGNYITVVDGVFLGKPCISINLKSEEGRGVARRLLAVADAVCSNYTPPVMAGFGLGPDDLRAIKPDLIVLELCGYGTPGPWADFPAYGPSTEAAGGMNALTGREADPPVRVGSGVFADQLSGRYAALALIAALNHRRLTGEGQYIDLSMAECITNLLGYFVLGSARTGHLPPRRGNRDAVFAPQGIYPCRGEDEWVALSVKNDGQWRELVALTRDPRLEDAAWANVEGRRRGHDEIDALIASWTRNRDKDEASALLQARGVAAGPVRKVQDSLFDRHLAQRGVYQMVRHERPVLGYSAHPHLTTPWVAGGRRRASLTDLHHTGEDNAVVLKRWLGMPAPAVRALVRRGALIDGGPMQVQTIPAPNVPISPDFGEQLGLPVPDAGPAS